MRGLQIDGVSYICHQVRWAGVVLWVKWPVQWCSGEGSTIDCVSYINIR